MPTPFTTTIELTKRNGVITLLVLVAILGLSLTVYSFANQAMLSHMASRASLRQSQLRHTAEDRIEYLRYQMLHASDRDWQRLVLGADLGDRKIVGENSEGMYSGNYRQVDRKTAAPGLASESAKLNIHSLDLSKSGEGISRSRLTSLPNVTLVMADSLLDWLDADDEPRTYGAESSWYVDKNRDFRPANGMVRQWRELLFVRGFDEALLFGEDTNLNGWLDWNEDDGDRQSPIDNQDGVLQRGMVEFLSLTSFESNIREDGRPKININDENLPRLYGQVHEAYGEQAATFIAAYRLDGPVVRRNAIDSTEIKKILNETIEERLRAQLTPLTEPSSISTRGTAIPSIRKNGLKLDRTPIHNFRSIIDLLDVAVITLIDEDEQQLNSPWQTQGLDVHAVLRSLEENLTIDKEPELIGRIDVRQATKEVLLTIPGLTQHAAESIVSLRQRRYQPPSNASLYSIYWLVEDQIVDLETLRKIAPYLTTNGAIYSGYATGYDPRSQSLGIVQFTLSHRGRSVRLLERREIGFASLKRWESLLLPQYKE